MYAVPWATKWRADKAGTYTAGCLTVCKRPMAYKPPFLKRRMFGTPQRLSWVRSQINEVNLSIYWCASPIYQNQFKRPSNLAAVSDLRSGVWSQNRKYCTYCVSEVLLFTKSSNGERNGQLEGYSARQCAFEDLQRCANSRRLTDGSDQSRNNDFLMWPDNVPTILCYFLAQFLRWMFRNMFTE